MRTGRRGKGGLGIDRAEKAARVQLREDALDFPVEVAGAVDDEVRVVSGGADESDAGGADGGLILLTDGFRRTAALFNVAAEASLEADVVGRLDIDAEMVEREEIGIVEREEALDEEKGRGLDELGEVGDARVC